MSAISTILTRLRAAIWAIDVRDDIANAIEQCYSDVSNPTLQTEALEAALQTKIDEGEMAALTIGDHTITAAKLAQGVIDNTLATSGAAADAKKTGDEISAIKADLDAVAFPTEAKEALVNCLKKVSWSNETDGEGLMNALEVALGITPSQRREELPAAYEQVTYIYGIAGQYINTGIKSQIPLEIQCEAGRGTGSPGIGAYNTSNAASRFFPFGFIPNNGNVYIGCRYANDTITIPGGTSEAQWLYSLNVATVIGEMYTVTSGIEAVTNSNNAKTYINVDGTRVEVERAKPILGNDIRLVNIPEVGTASRLKLGYFKAYSGSTLLADYIPCYRKSDNVAGFYDVVSSSFKINQGSGGFEVGDVVY